MKVDFSKLDRAFNPRCVVVVGDSSTRAGAGIGTDFPWLRGQSTFKGKLYSVQVNPETIKDIEAMGVKNYTSIVDVPEPVDLAIVAVPRPVAQRILEDCIRKDVAVAHFFTAGYSETGTEEGKKLERILTERAKEANFHLIGPNCMGLFNPKVGIKQFPVQYTGFTGPLGFISQSGGHAMNFAMEAHYQGLDMAKSVSFGNGTVLESSDFLEYFGQDPEIKVIGMYVEGVKDGPRFLRVLREVAARKPVVIWKGGRTEEGVRAISSHTGSLALPQAIWNAAINQCGAIKVTRSEELVDTLKALLHLPPVRGDRMGITGGSGGQTVALADVFAEAGLRVPRLTQKSYDELNTFFLLVGSGLSNPIDIGGANRSEMKRVLDILEQDANIDNLVLLVNVGIRTPAENKEPIELLTEIKKKTSKPVMAVILSANSPKEVEVAQDIIRGFRDVDIPTFMAFERGARALRNALDYYNHKSSAS